MKAKHRKGKEIPVAQRREIIETLHHRCQGCGEDYTPNKRDWKHPSAPALEIHHGVPISQGGDKKTDAYALCGPNMCHAAMDELAKDGIYFNRVESELGHYPLQDIVIEGRVKEVVNEVRRRLHLSRRQAG